jgi:hypothetical protein
VDDLPVTPNLHCFVDTTLPRHEVAELFRQLGVTVRKCGWDEFEVLCPWAEFVIESEFPILMHGSVVNVTANVERLLAPLRDAGVAYTAECYDDHNNLVKEVKWPL